MRGYPHERRGKMEKGAAGRQKRKEIYARILDFLPYGHLDDARPVYQKRPLAQAVGEDQFILIELSPKKDKAFAPYERVYIGEGEREKIDHVIKRLRYEELTPTAKVELHYVLAIIVKENEERFLKAFNNAKPITTRLHTLDLFPGIGKKLMWAIVEARKAGEFTSFDDLTQRVKGLHHPEKIIARRIEDEIIDEQIKYRLFTP